MKKFNQLREEVFTLVNMDDASVKVAMKLAKKAGLKPKISKGKLGTDFRVDGPFKKVMKFANSLPNESVVNEALNLVLSFGLKGNLPDGDGKKLIDTFAKKARVKVKHMMGGFEVYGDPISQNRFLNSVVNSKPLLKYLDTK